MKGNENETHMKGKVNEQGEQRKRKAK